MDGVIPISNETRTYTLPNGKSVMAKRITRAQFNRCMAVAMDMAKNQQSQMILVTDLVVRLSLAGQVVSGDKPQTECVPMLGNVMTFEDLSTLSGMKPEIVDDVAAFACAAFNLGEDQKGNS